MHKEFNKGLLLAGFGSFWWGFFGVIYFKYLEFIGYIEVVIHRCLWTAITLILTTETFADDKIKLGLDVYNNKANCGACHTLQAATSIGEIGPNLDMLKPQVEQIILAVTNGIGVMPPWEGILTQEEIEAVAYYIFNSTSK